MLLRHDASHHVVDTDRRASSPLRALIIRALVIGLAVLTAGVAGAASFTVTLSNGTSFLTRERPVVADWDDSVVLIRTDQGNWIALQKDEVVDVASQAEISGFGYQVDTQTLFLGWTPNDILDEAESDEEGGGGGGDGEDRPYYENEELYDAPQGGGVLEQFVDVPLAGETIGGVDLGPTVTNRDNG